MSDTAAFFANKKKKKKAPFKFNANLIDASSVATAAVHVDAPAVSTDVSGGLSSGVAGLGLGTDNDRSDPNNDEQWDDEAMASAAVTAASSRKNLSSAASAAAGIGGDAAAAVLDYKSVAPKHGAGNNIAEKLRVEETKAQLAAAREGMEREAQKNKEEKERKEQEAASKAAAAATAVGGGGNRWLPPHLRAGGGGLGAPTPNRFGGVVGGKLDVQSEELFPDLASAEKILEQKEKEQQTAFRIPKKTPVGGGATWASKPSIPAPATASPPAPLSAPSEPAQPETPARDSAADESEAPEASAKSTEAAAPAKTLPKIATKKKAKKDLSTFKPGG